MKQIPLTQGKFALVDDEDYEWLSQQKWFARRRWDGKAFVAFANIKLADGRRAITTMHRQIMEPPVGMVVDHIDGDSLNNTRANLRVCSQFHNVINRRPSTHRAVPFKGVSLAPRSKTRPWRARITIRGVTTQVGSFATQEEAARAYDAAALKYHGEFARLNFPPTKLR